MTQTLVFGGVFLLVGIAFGYLTRQFLSAKQASSVEQKSRQIILEAQEKAVTLLDDVKKEERERKSQADKFEERLRKKEEQIDQQTKNLTAQEGDLKTELQKIEDTKHELSDLQIKAVSQLEKISGLSAQEAKVRMMKELEDQHKYDLLKKIQELEKDRREEIEKKSLDIITTAMQRYARSNVADVTTTVFTLPSEDLKGKIIGREGRNIKTLERLTGAELLLDESPESIIISSFDPLRRETARLALEKLIKDGRIQPAKIEEKVTEAQGELERRMVEIGEQTALDLGIIDLPKEILQLIGRLHFRTSYGQNVLVHSLEMAYISGMIASEIGANVDVAKRGALLHDIGKAISHEVEGTHVNLGRKLLQKYNIDPRVIQAMEAHHEEYPFSTPESYIVATADILSAARPGARRDNVENYLKRLGDLEKIAAGFEGVKQVYALSAGREIRIFVVPEKIDDFGAYQLAKNVATKVQSELKFPGEIKVNVIRETRAVEYAR